MICAISGLQACSSYAYNTGYIYEMKVSFQCTYVVILLVSHCFVLACCSSQSTSRGLGRCRRGFILAYAVSSCIGGISADVYTEQRIFKHKDERKCVEGMGSEGENHKCRRPDEPLSFSEMAWFISGVVLLVILGGLISGLTIGLMSLDETNLTVLQRSGTPKERKYATTILPVRRNGYLLLCTLLIANAIVSEALPILMDRLVLDPWSAIFLSTVLILLFAEIIPQAFFTKFGLYAGAKLIWLVRLFIAILFPLAYPLSLLVEKVIGKSEGIKYKRHELKELVLMLTGNQLTTDEVTIMTGVLELIDKRATQIMIPLGHVYMLDMNSVIDESLISDISAKGYSRIPLYLGTRENVVAILLTKVLISPVFGTRLSDLPLGKVYRVKSTMPLFEIMTVLRQGYHGHLAVVVDDRTQLPIGILTLEDIIEELLQQEIMDETDDVSTGEVYYRKRNFSWMASSFLTGKMGPKHATLACMAIDTQDNNASDRATATAQLHSALTVLASRSLSPATGESQPLLDPLAINNSVEIESGLNYAVPGHGHTTQESRYHSSSPNIP